MHAEFSFENTQIHFAGGNACGPIVGLAGLGADFALVGAKGQRLVRAATLAGRQQLYSEVRDQRVGDVAGGDLRSRRRSTRNWAGPKAMGMNTMRVFLHDLLWQQDAAGFQKRIDQFLTIAARHHIRPLLVLFDSCWDPFPHLGRSIRRFRECIIRAGCRVRVRRRWAIRPISAAESLCAGRRRSIRQRRSHSGLGCVE